MACRLSDDLEPIGEFHTENQFWQLVVAVEASPSFLRSFNKLEDHGERGAVRQAALRPDRAVAHGCERAFDRVRGSQVLPVLGGEVVESQQRIAILGQAFGGFLVLDLVALDESIECSLSVSLRLGDPDLLQRAFGLGLLALRQLAEQTVAVLRVHAEKVVLGRLAHWNGAKELLNAGTLKEVLRQ